MALHNLLKKDRDQDDSHHRANLDPRYERPPAPQHDETNWLVSYADMMTLLCGFFIMLFSIAKLDDGKYEKVKEAVSQQFGGQYSAPNVELGKFATQFIQELGISQQASVRVDPRGVAITFESTLFFDTLSAEIRPAGVDVIKKVIDQLIELQTREKIEYRIVVEGHTDGRAILGGPFPSNWELSSSRASRVVRMFLEKGFKPQKMTAIGYADSYPLAAERSPNGDWVDENLQRNRRVVVWVLRPEVDQLPLPSENSGYARPAATAPAAAVSPAAPTLSAPTLAAPAAVNPTPAAPAAAVAAQPIVAPVVVAPAAATAPAVAIPPAATQPPPVNPVTTPPSPAKPAP